MSSSTSLRVKELLREKGWTTKVLAEKTGMSESYLTHIKNATRRWNEDSLKKLAVAFELNPVDLFSQQKQRTDNVQSTVTLPEKIDVNLRVTVIPVLGDIPSNPSPYNNQLTQVTTGCQDQFVPIINGTDPNSFALKLSSNAYSPSFEKGDLLIISPETWAHSGDIAAVEYGNETTVRSIVKITYTDDFVVLESVNYRQAPIALVRGKDHFRIIGRVTARHQALCG